MRRILIPILALTLTACNDDLKVIDGDSIVLHGRQTRLHGMDAPELKQECQTASLQSWRCGRAARDELNRLIGSAKIICWKIYHDSYQRPISQCFANGQDIGEAMVRSGYAVAYRRYSSRYIDAETEARSHRRGVWAGIFEYPEQWRIKYRENNAR